MNEVSFHNLQWNPMPVKGFEGKPLIDHKNGGLKMVKINPGSEFPLHQHPDKTEFAFVLEGTLEATIGDTKNIGKAGTFFQFPVGITHGLKNPAETDTIVLIGSFSEEK